MNEVVAAGSSPLATTNETALTLALTIQSAGARAVPLHREPSERLACHNLLEGKAKRLDRLVCGDVRVDCSILQIPSALPFLNLAKWIK